MFADALLCSHPRSGGRWLRYLLAHYMVAHERLEMDLDPQTIFSVVPDHHQHESRGYPAFRFRDHAGLPLVAVCHQRYSWEHHRGYPIAFLARNPYDVMVSTYFYLTREKREYSGTMRSLIQHPRLGLPEWIQYVNSWAPELLRHRDAVLVSYREMDGAPQRALGRVLEFLGLPVEPALVQAAVSRGDALRSARGIRTGQEGNFWDHLQPEEIFEIQEVLHPGLSEAAVHLLKSMGVEIDPFPRPSLS